MSRSIFQTREEILVFEIKIIEKKEKFHINKGRDCLAFLSFPHMFCVYLKIHQSIGKRLLRRVRVCYVTPYEFRINYFQQVGVVQHNPLPKIM